MLSKLKNSKQLKLFSLVILFILGKGIDYYISNHSDKNDLFIKFLDYTYNLKMIWIVFVVIIIITLIPEIYEIIITPYEIKIQEKDRDISEKNRLLEVKTGALVTKLKDLFCYYEKEILYNHLKKLTEKNTIINSAQIYTYSKNIDNEYTTIKVNYVNGFAFEDVDINAMIQNYYKIPNDVYLKITNILENAKKLGMIYPNRNIAELKANSEIYETIKKDVELKIKEFIIEWVPKIKNKNSDELNESDSIIFSLIELCYEIIIKISNEYSDNEVYSINIFKDENSNMILRNIKRLGILSGILKVNEHVFKNLGYSRKKGRVYITRCFELNDKDYIILISLFPNIIEFHDWKDLISNISIEFIKNLKIDIEMLYNDDIESE